MVFSIRPLCVVIRSLGETTSGDFAVLPPIPTGLLAEQLRHVVLDYLVEGEAITEEFALRLPGLETLRIIC
jgi:hypothetical protein